MIAARMCQLALPSLSVHPHTKPNWLRNAERIPVGSDIHEFLYFVNKLQFWLKSCKITFPSRASISNETSYTTSKGFQTYTSTY